MDSVLKKLGTQILGMKNCFAVKTNMSQTYVSFIYLGPFHHLLSLSIYSRGMYSEVCPTCPSLETFNFFDNIHYR